MRALLPALRMYGLNVTLSGNGAASILKRMWNSNTIEEGIIAITATNGGCCVKNLQIYGITIPNNQLGIYISEDSNNNTIANNVFNNNYIGLDVDSDTNLIVGNICNNNSNSLQIKGLNNVVTSNTCNENDNCCISCGCQNSLIVGNVCNNSVSGISISMSSNNVITSNTCNGNDVGINSAFSNNNIITGNTCIRGTGESSDYTSSQYTIKLSSYCSANLIVGNLIMGKNYVDSGTNNTFANNKYQ